MLTHNTHYATFKERGRIVGYACFDIFKSKYYTYNAGWGSSKKTAELFPNRELVKDVFFEARFFATPVFESDNNEMARRGYGIKGV